MGMWLLDVASGAAMMRGTLMGACRRLPIRRFCGVCFRVLHTIALVLIAASALMYLTAALGLWEELAHTADVFGCADQIAVNREDSVGH